MTKQLRILLLSVCVLLALCLTLLLFLVLRPAPAVPSRPAAVDAAATVPSLVAEPDKTALSSAKADRSEDGAPTALSETPFADATAAEAPVQTQPLWAETLPAQLDALLPESGGVWAVYVEDLNSGASVQAMRGTTAEEPLIAASIIKLFIMATVYDRIEQGLLLEDAVADDLSDMITHSDNDAANRLVRLLGGGDAAAGRQAVNDYARSIGCAQVRLNRLMLEQNGTENYVSVQDCVALLRMLYYGDCVSAEASGKMMTLLLAQYYRDYIPARLPASVPIAHKGGDLAVCQGDVGIVFAGTSPYLVCIIENGSWSDGNTDRIGELSLCIYEALTAP